MLVIDSITIAPVSILYQLHTSYPNVIIMVEYANQPTTSTYAAGEDKTADVIELLQNLDPVGGQETTLLVRRILTL
jgi:hypothetical protein